MARIAEPEQNNRKNHRPTWRAEPALLSPAQMAWAGDEAIGTLGVFKPGVEASPETRHAQKGAFRPSKASGVGCIRQQHPLFHFA